MCHCFLLMPSASWSVNKLKNAWHTTSNTAGASSSEQAATCITTTLSNVAAAVLTAASGGCTIPVSPALAMATTVDVDAAAAAAVAAVAAAAAALRSRSAVTYFASKHLASLVTAKIPSVINTSSTTGCIDCVNPLMWHNNSCVSP